MTVTPLYYLLVASTISLTGLAVIACGDDESREATIGVEELTSSECIRDAAASLLPKDTRCVVFQREGKTLSLQVFGLETVCLEHELTA